MIEFRLEVDVVFFYVFNIYLTRYTFHSKTNVIYNSLDDTNWDRIR